MHFIILPHTYYTTFSLIMNVQMQTVACGNDYHSYTSETFLYTDLHQRFSWIDSARGGMLCRSNSLSLTLTLSYAHRPLNQIVCVATHFRGALNVGCT